MGVAQETDGNIAQEYGGEFVQGQGGDGAPELDGEFAPESGGRTIPIQAGRQTAVKQPNAAGPAKTNAANPTRTSIVNPARLARDRVILGIDPGTNVMGYGLLQVKDGKVSYLALGVLKLNKYEDHYLRLRKIFERTQGLIDEFLPDELAIEAPFVGKNVQSMLKLGHAQGCAIAAAVIRDIPISEYAPQKIKMAITGNGHAVKEQVADMIGRILKIPQEDLVPQMDATDALAVAYCHYLETSRPTLSGKSYKSWKDFAEKNPGKCGSGQTAASQGPASLKSLLERQSRRPGKPLGPRER